MAHPRTRCPLSCILGLVCACPNVGGEPTGTDTADDPTGGSSATTTGLTTGSTSVPTTTVTTGGTTTTGDATTGAPPTGDATTGTDAGTAGTTSTSDTSSTGTTEGIGTTEQTGGALCVPDATEHCYDGADGTEDVGVCMPGLRTCNADGTDWGPCVGQVLPGVEDCETPLDEDCDGQTPACPATTLCAKRFGPALAYAVALDAAGNLAVTGTFAGAVDLGGGPLVAESSDIFVAKFDAACNHLWSKQFGAGYGTGYAVEFDAAGSVLVTGYFFGPADFGAGEVVSEDVDVFLVKLDAAGVHQWSKRFGDYAGDQYGLGLDVGPADRIALTGNLPGTADFGGGTVKGSGFVAVFDSNGIYQWSRGWTDGRGKGVAFHPGGGLVVAGAMDGIVDFGGGPLVNVQPGDDLYVARFDAAGVHQWSKSFSGAVNFYAVDMGVDAAGDVLVGGPFSGTLGLGGVQLQSAGANDIFLAKLTGAGALVYGKRFGSPAEDTLYRLALSVDSEPVLTGSFAGTLDFGAGQHASAGGSDIFVARLDAAGDAVWSKSFGDAAEQYGYGVAVDGAGNVAFAGRVAGTVDFGTGPLAGGDDGFFAKLAP